MPLGVEYGTRYELIGPSGDVAVFNDSTSGNFVGMLSPESSGLDSPEVRESAQDATEADGGVHGDFYYGRRPVVLQGTILATSATDRNTKVERLLRASDAMRGDATLKWKPVGATEEVELKLRRQQPVRITKGFVKDFFVPLVAADAYIKGVTTNKSTLTIVNEPAFITTPTSISGIAVNSTHIFWTNGTTIGRAAINGTGGNNSFITGITSAVAVAVDGAYIYWADDAGGRIGRAKLDGTEVNLNFITAPVSPRGVAVDATYIYWTEGGTGTIGRAKISGVEPSTEFITGLTTPLAIAVNATHIYWTEGASTEDIGRAKIGGTEANSNFISEAFARGLALNGTHIYWSDAGTKDSIARALLAGTSREDTFITSSTEPWGVAVDATYVYWAEKTGADAVARHSIITSDTDVVVNAGSAAAPVTAKLTGIGSSVVLQNATTGEQLTLEGLELAEGEYILLDFGARTIKKNGTESLYGALDRAASDWWRLAPGSNTLEVTGASAEISWQNAYI
jgi:virginiamycin B lyase